MASHNANGKRGDHAPRRFTHVRMALVKKVHHLDRGNSASIIGLSRDQF